MTDETYKFGKYKDRPITDAPVGYRKKWATDVRLNKSFGTPSTNNAVAQSLKWPLPHKYLSEIEFIGGTRAGMKIKDCPCSYLRGVLNFPHLSEIEREEIEMMLGIIPVPAHMKIILSNPSPVETPQSVIPCNPITPETRYRLLHLTLQDITESRLRAMTELEGQEQIAHWIAERKRLKQDTERFEKEIIEGLDEYMAAKSAC